MAMSVKKYRNSNGYDYDPDYINMLRFRHFLVGVVLTIVVGVVAAQFIT